MCVPSRQEIEQQLDCRHCINSSHERQAATRESKRGIQCPLHVARLQGIPRSPSLRRRLKSHRERVRSRWAQRRRPRTRHALSFMSRDESVSGSPTRVQIIDPTLLVQEVKKEQQLEPSTKISSHQQDAREPTVLSFYLRIPAALLLLLSRQSLGCWRSRDSRTQVSLPLSLARRSSASNYACLLLMPTSHNTT